MFQKELSIKKVLLILGLATTLMFVVACGPPSISMTIDNGGDDGGINGSTDGGINGSTDGGINGSTDGGINGSTDGGGIDVPPDPDDGNGSMVVPEKLVSDVAKAYAVALNLDANELNATLEIIQNYSSDGKTTEEYITDLTARRNGVTPNIGDIVGDRLGFEAAQLTREVVEEDGSIVTKSYRDEIVALSAKYIGLAKALRPSDDALRGVLGVELFGENVQLDGDILIKNNGDFANTINLRLIIAESSGEDVDAIFKELKEVASRRGVVLDDGSGYVAFPDEHDGDEHDGDDLSGDASTGGYAISRAFYSKRRTNLWNNGVIRYRWDRSIIPEHKAALIRAMNEWTTGIGSDAVQFVDVTNLADPFKDGAVVDYKTGEANGFGWAIIGTYNDLRRPTELVLDIKNTEENYKGIYQAGVVNTTALHEIGHVLGAWHEHQRYDRDDYIIVTDENQQDKVNYGRIAHYNYGAGAEPRRRIVGGVMLNTVLFTGVGVKNTIGSDSYDVSSIMHYNGFLLKKDVVGCNGVKYFKAANSFNRGRSPYISTLSPCDSSAVRNWYK